MAKSVIQTGIAVVVIGIGLIVAAVLGLFRRNDKTRNEFFAHLARPAPGA